MAFVRGSTARSGSRIRLGISTTTLGAVVLLMSACGSSSHGTSTGTTAPAPGTSAPSGSTGGAQLTGTTLLIGSIQSETSAAAPATNTQAPDALNAWVKWTNTHGGVAGHPVKVVIIDDKSDPANALSAAQVLTQQDHVIAIVGETAATTDGAWGPYILQHKVPVIGGAQTDPIWFTNPMFYPVGGDVVANIWGQMKSAAVQGVTKVGVVLCTESPSCAQAETVFKSDARAVGMDPVYVTLASSTQASYTAECLAAKQAGAQALAAFVNDALLARNCSEQNFNPKWINADEGPTLSTIQAVPALGNAVGSSEHWNCAGPPTPDTMDFYQAMRMYAPQWLRPSGAKAGIAANGDCAEWDAAEAFALAVKNAGVAPTATATSADIIRGLSMFHATRVGGYTPPMTYSDGTKPNPIANCTYLYKYEGTTLLPVPSTTGYTCMS
jgi:branched-chain amino acid transport system substrate-binding protein